MMADLISLWRGKRGERRPPAGALALPGPLLAILARRRRKKGFYDLRTLALYRAAWRRRPSPGSLLEYVLYRRDLGHLLPQQWIALLLAGLGQLRTGERRLALAMVAETAPRRLADIPDGLVNEGAGHMAPLASRARRTGSDSAPAWLAMLEERQQEWRESFADQLRQGSSQGICLVGNGGSLQGGGHGGWIDSHGMVVRFNRFASAQSELADIGVKLHVWVGAPGFPDGPPEEAKWAAISGPDMLFRRQNWKPLRDRLELGRPVLTVPLAVWRPLASRLCAPPSAGLLMLAWVKTLMGNWESIATVGMGVAPSQERPYHHADSAQKPGERHNWEAEHLLLRQWRAEGLRMK